jgi:hypothetical protein
MDMVDAKEENFDNFEQYVMSRPVRNAMNVAVVQALLGIGAATLAVIGLEHFAAASLLAIATIVVGAALLFEGGLISARFSALRSQMEKVPFRFRRWMGMEFVAGTGGVTLGILALLHFTPLILIPIAAMALGIAQIINSGLNTRLNAMEMSGSKSDGLRQEAARETVIPYAGIEGFVGLGALVLGLIALSGISPLVLSLVAILSVAAGHLFNGAVVFRMLNATYRRHAE